MGMVYKARHIALGRVVALKTLRGEHASEPDHVQRFEREMRAVARLDHPNIVRIYDVGQLQNQPYYTMPYLPGGSLAGQRQRLFDDPQAAVAVIEKIAVAVHYAHEHGVLHRDLKPGNVLLDERGEPLVCDFGLAKLQEPGVELTYTGAVLGTPAYMAPEQAAGRSAQIGPASDVWSLGVMLYELLTGRRPFVGDGTDEVKRKIQTDEPPAPRALRPELDTSLEAVLCTCLEKDPARRYPSAAALAEDLARCLRGEALARRTRWTRRWWRGVRRRPIFSAALLLCALVLVAGSAWAIVGLVRKPDTSTAKATDPPSDRLLGEKRWLAGERKTVILRAEPGEFSLRTDGVCLIELPPAPPWDHYRLEAKVRSEDLTEGEIGIFCAHGRYPSGDQRYQLSWNVHFAERSQRVGTANLVISRLLEAPKDPLNDLTLPGPRPAAVPAGPAKAPGPWHVLALDVNGDGIRAFLDSDCIGEAPLADLDMMCARALKFVPNVKGEFTRHGSFGIYINQGAATFERFVVMPLP
jgi:serine/threonine protein kinase